MLAEDYYYWDETFEESHNATMIDICEAKIGMKTLPCKRALSVLGEFVGGGWRPATHLPRASQTCSFGSMSGKHAGHSIRTIHSSKRKSSTRLARGSLQLSSIKMKSSPIAAA
ncbi:hypothetical protein TNCV_2688741 [Trichonephila clavipes]|nr:hypothetical protein TNCV_2688741 [Trichonephila clavipes]